MKKALIAAAIVGVSTLGVTAQASASPLDYLPGCVLSVDPQFTPPEALICDPYVVNGVTIFNGIEIKGTEIH